MRKAISVFFILLANMVILAHTVVPHHHHNKVFASVVSLFDGDAQHKSEHHHGTTHHHNDTDKSEECLINEVYVATFRVQDDAEIAQPLHINLDWHPLFAITSFSSGIPILQAFSFRQKPYIELIHPIFITHSSGLRAPPFC